MRLPIPNDWLGAWRCVQVQWPDSTLWDAMLNGWLSQFKRGWLWDEKTGDLMSVIGVGWEIWLRNQALTACAVYPPPGPEIVYVPVGGGAEGESKDMGQVVTDVTINEDGQLVVWFGQCCTKVLDIAVDGAPALPDDPLNPNDETLTYYACGKANAVVETIFSVVKECHDEIDNLPWQWVSHVEAGVGLDLNNTWLLSTVAQCEIMEGLAYDFDEILSTAEKNWLKCRLVDLMVADGNAPADTVFDAARDLMSNHQGADIFAMNLWDYAFLALGQTNFNNVAMLGATDSTATCDCENSGAELPDLWPEYGWYHRWDFADYATQPALLDDGGQGSWLANTGLVSVDTGNTRDIWPILKIAVGGGTMRRIAFKLKVPIGGTNWDDNSLGTVGGELQGQSMFPVPSPYAASWEFWWDVPCSVALTVNTDPYCTIYGGATGLADGLRFECTGIAIAGEGTDAFPA